jgi:hypothetical protein
MAKCSTSGIADRDVAGIPRRGCRRDGAARTLASYQPARLCCAQSLSVLTDRVGERSTPRTTLGPRSTSVGRQEGRVV